MKNNELLFVFSDDQLLTKIKDGIIHPGTIENPLDINEIGSNIMYAIAYRNFIGNGANESAVIKFNARPGDVLLTAIVALDRSEDLSLYFYQVDQELDDGMTRFFFFNSEEMNYYPPSEDSTEAPVSCTNSVFKAKAFFRRRNVESKLGMSFIAVDNSTGEVVGCFKWNITVNTESNPK